MKKAVYLTGVIVVGLLFLTLYQTYAMFTSSVSSDTVINLDTTLNYKFKINTTQTFKVDANTVLHFNAIIENEMEGSIKYGIYHNYNLSSNTNVQIGEIVLDASTVTTSPNGTGVINASESKTVPIAIINNSNATIEVSFGITTGYTSNTLTYPANTYALVKTIDDDAIGSASCESNLTYNEEDCYEEIIDNLKYKKCTIVVNVEEIPENATQPECFTFDASTGTITDYLCYEGNTNSLPIITDVTIPKKINEVTVNTIGDSSFKEKNITNVVIPNTVSTIGNYAFQSNNLENINLSNNITSLGVSSFEFNKITALSIPSSITTISDYAFSFNKITSLDIPINIESIGIGAFRYNDLTNLIIPNNVTSIGTKAFEYNLIENLTIGTNISIISSYAFHHNRLATINIPNNITTIGDYAFYENFLTSLNIPGSVTSVGEESFRTNKISTLTLNEGLQTIGKKAFSENLITKVTIPNTVTTISSYAFNNNSLGTVYIGANSQLTPNTGIGLCAFISSDYTHTSSYTGASYVDNPNLRIYNNSGKKFRWYYATQGRYNQDDSQWCFITGTVPQYINSVNETYYSVTITTGGNP